MLTHDLIPEPVNERSARRSSLLQAHSSQRELHVPGFHGVPEDAGDARKEMRAKRLNKETRERRLEDEMRRGGRIRLRMEAAMAWPRRSRLSPRRHPPIPPPMRGRRRRPRSPAY